MGRNPGTEVFAGLWNRGKRNVAPMRLCIFAKRRLQFFNQVTCVSLKSTLPGAPPCARDAASSLLAKFKSKVPTSICTNVDGSACVELADLRSGHRSREPLGTRSRNPEASGSERFERDPEPPCKKKRLIPNLKHDTRCAEVFL